MRISDWSSDVCSSDLDLPLVPRRGGRERRRPLRRASRSYLSLGNGVVHLLRSDVLRRFLRRIVLRAQPVGAMRSEEHTSELQSLMRISYAVFCLKKKKHNTQLLSNTDTINLVKTKVK